MNLQTRQYEYVSPSSTILVGYTPEEMLQLREDEAIKRVHPDDMPKLLEAEDLSMKIGEAEAEYRQRKKNGEYIWVSNHMSITKDSTGRPLFRNFSLRDITERKRTDNIKDEFLGMVSHELKTPLTVIIGALAVANNKNIPIEQVRDLINDADVYAHTLADIIENLLELSRYQSNRLALQREQVDIAKVGRMVAERLKGRSSIHTIKLDFPDAIPEVMIDRVRVERILNNLIENAIKYSPEGGEVVITARQDNSQLTISVKDQGIGISAEDQQKLFRSFERINAYQTYAISGLGLGLTVCRILVEAHGGKIWVESRPGEGSTFSFTVPLASDEKTAG